MNYWVWAVSSSARSSVWSLAAAPLRVSSTSLQLQTCPAPLSLQAPRCLRTKLPTSRLLCSSAARSPDTSWSWRTLKTTTTRWIILHNAWSEKIVPVTSACTGPCHLCLIENKKMLPSYLNMHCLLHSCVSAHSFCVTLIILHYCMFKFYIGVIQHKEGWFDQKKSKAMRLCNGIRQSVPISQYHNIKAFAHTCWIFCLKVNRVFSKYKKLFHT